MSINLVPKQLELPDLATEIARISGETGIVPQALNFEIVETVVMEDADRSLAVLSSIKALGARISIDDFGTGYSSLSRLPGFPVDILKIDRTFIANMNSDRESHEIVRLIIMLAHSVGLNVVAEGTETEDQIHALKELGCEMAQGFLYSPPVSSELAFQMLAKTQKAALLS
jgi:EAL domain-containing protein (putative c-di-GMP-specific phosphodiesterase class I)